MSPPRPKLQRDSATPTQDAEWPDLQAGLPATLCTDNPGISQTTLAHEYLTAARMTEGGLTQWEALTLMRQGFVHAFLPSAEREALLKRCDERVFGLATQHNP